ncbi:MAG TPA: phosphate acyltransferase PlsX [Solirubrobacterales bacterium]|nr:phosphate acyltransferase PlsX [Solirubrobacterales bacterium]
MRAAASGGARCIVFGPAAELNAELAGVAEVVDAPVGISNSEDPARAVRAKPDASIVQAARAVADGRADALVSAGSTGATLAAGLLQVKRMRGVHRPGLAVLLPVPGRPTLLLDVGATVEVRPEQLVQFAFMGSAFMEGVMGVSRPRVGLLNVGAEPEKGTPAVAEAHARLAALAHAPFVFTGNVEGGDLVGGAADVVVTDGFTGNVALKLMEGTTRTLVGAIRDAIRAGTASKLGGLLIRSRLGELRARLDPESVGGAYLLGLRGLAIVCHGSSSRRAIASAVALAERGVEEGVTARTGAALEAAGVARAAPDAASVPADTVNAP